MCPTSSFDALAKGKRGVRHCAAFSPILDTWKTVNLQKNFIFAEGGVHGKRGTGKRE